jgi:arsenite-transporting ATPase
VDEGKDGLVVLDTAPTGHTLLLLDATEAYHRQVLHTRSELPEAVRQLLPRLRDPEYTMVFIIALPEATPVHEAAQLQRDLVRAKINPYAWVVNQSLAPLTLTDPALQSKRESEFPYIHEVRQDHASRMAIVPWMVREPVGPENLRAMIEDYSDRLPAEVR